MTTITLDIRATLLEYLGASAHLPMSDEVECLLDKASRNYTINVDQALAKEGEIAITWSIEDVKGARPDLNDEQAWEVLFECKDKHDAECGFTYTFIKGVADEMFPEHDDSDEGEQP